MAGTQDLSAFIPQVWSKKILMRLDRINVMLRLVNREYEGDIRAAGDTVWVRTFGDIAFSAYKRNGLINYGNQVPTKEALQVNDAQNFAFNIDDLDEAQMDINALNGYTQRAAVGMGYVVENKIMAQYPKAHVKNRVDGGIITGGTTTNGVMALGAGTVTGGAATGVPLQIDATTAYLSLVQAAAKLNRQNAPRDGRWAILDSDHEAAIIADTKYFIRATDMGDKIVQSGRLGMTASEAPGFLGRAAGFDLYASNACPSDATGTYELFGAGPVISYAGQLRKIEQIRRETTWGTSVRGLLLHDATVFGEHAKGLGYIYKQNNAAA